MHNQQGSVVSTALPVIVLTILFLLASALAANYYTKYNALSKNYDQKLTEAVEQAKKEQAELTAAEYEEKLKFPHRKYVTPDVLSNVKIVYPNTWSAYIYEGTSSRPELDAYFHPDFVPSTRYAADVNYGLRATLKTESYSSAVSKFDRLVEKGSVSAKAITISGIKGIRLDGEILNGKEGAMVLVPIRDKTLKIWTESKDYLGDFNNITIKNLSFKP